jgi:large subunit ribosomal protein L25
MKQPEPYILEGVVREPGSKSSAQLRNDLRIPSVLYGPKIEKNIHFSVSEADLEKILSVSQTKLQLLTIDGKEYKTLLVKVEYDPITDRALHADFYVLDPETPVKLSIPIRLTGIAKGVRDSGGRIFQPLRIVRIKVVPEKIPALFELDISNLGIGDSLHVSELELEGIEPLDEPSRTIVTIAPPKSDKVFTSALEEEDELDEAIADAEQAEEGEESAEGPGEADEAGEPKE